MSAAFVNPCDVTEDIPILNAYGEPVEEHGTEVSMFNGEPGGPTADWTYWDGGSAMMGERFDAPNPNSDFQTVYYVDFDEEAGTMTWVDHQECQCTDMAMTVTGYVAHEWTYDPETGEVASQGLGADVAFFPDGGSGHYDGTTLTMPIRGEDFEFVKYTEKPTTRGVRMPKKKKMFGCC
jgi:hypothetical protein